MFLNLNENQAFQAMQAIKEMRTLNIKCELYPEVTKMDKQFKHAEKRGIPFVVKEINDAIFTLKNLLTGEQLYLNFNDLIIKVGNS